MANDKTLTSVKIKSDLFNEFKIECVKRKFSFQKLADRAIHLYLTDEDFRKQISNHNNLELQIMKEGYIPKEQRKNILLLTDDIRFPSGVGHIGKQ